MSVVVPARNEAGNIREIFDRTPAMGTGTELIFVEGHSTDDTYDAIQRAMAVCPDLDVKLFRQSGDGKGDAVRLGFAKASGEVLLILDADLTVPPEDLPRFYEAWRLGRGEFINGVRLIYPRKQQAMRVLNFLGNKFFSLAFTWLLGQSIKDTLCGTKAVSRRHYEMIAANRSYFGTLDPICLNGRMKRALISRIPFYLRSRCTANKVAAHWYAANYREAYGISICNGILFNHKSEGRGETFLTRKITAPWARSRSACDTSCSSETWRLGATGDTPTTTWKPCG